MELIGLVLICVAATYFLPTFIVLNKEHPHGEFIFLLNLFAGWTFFGWLIALIWSLTDPQGG